MQRRAAAVSAVVFLLLAAGSYAYIGVAEEPDISVEGEHTLGPGGSFTGSDGTTYHVTGLADGSPSVYWHVAESTYTAQIENNSTVSAAHMAWEGQTERETTTLQNNSDVEYDGATYRVVIAAGPNPTAFNLTRDGTTQTFTTGDTLTYQGEQVTVVSVTTDAVHLAWGADYRVLTAANETPVTVTFRQVFNVTERLREDSEVQNTLYRAENGTKYVKYHDGGLVLLDEYLPDPESATFDLGQTVTYRGNQSNVSSISSSAVTLTWTAPRNRSVSLSEGANVTLDQKYVAHFPADSDSVVLSTNFGAYQHDVERQSYFTERINGLWAVAILAALTAFFLLAMAYMPSRY